MLAKSKRTLDVYKRCGAKLRLCKSFLPRLISTMEQILPKTDTDKIQKAVNVLQEISNKAENRMYTEYPNIGHDYTNVFYGDMALQLERTDLDGVEKEVCGIARDILRRYLGETGPANKNTDEITAPTPFGTLHAVPAMTRATVMAEYDDGHDRIRLGIVIEYDPGLVGPDPLPAMRAAAAEYCRTEAGLADVRNNNGDFNWGDFVTSVPEGICRRHGFAVVDTFTAGFVVDHDEHLAPLD